MTANENDRHATVLRQMLTENADPKVNFHLTGTERAAVVAAIAALAAPEGCGVALIAAERQRQVSVEGWTPEHDDEHACNELATAAACYAAPDTCGYEDDEPTKPRAAILAHWPWSVRWWKPSDRIRELTKAGALIAAEIDRLQRAAGVPTR